MKYKVGDKVRVRKDLENGIKYGVTGVTEEMTKLKGRIVTIKEVNEYTYRIKEMTYVWTDEMFEPVITNWDKVKEEIELDVENTFGNMICKAINKIRDEKTCLRNDNRNCEECKRWLKLPYKESILDEAEKKYLSNVIKPWRDRVEWIRKSQGIACEYIEIRLNEGIVHFPYFDKNTMYKGMELNKEYSLDELEI